MINSITSNDDGLVVKYEREHGDPDDVRPEYHFPEVDTEGADGYHRDGVRVAVTAEDGLPPVDIDSFRQELAEKGYCLVD